MKAVGSTFGKILIVLGIIVGIIAIALSLFLHWYMYDSADEIRANSIAVLELRIPEVEDFFYANYEEFEKLVEWLEAENTPYERDSASKEFSKEMQFIVAGLEQKGKEQVYLQSVNWRYNYGFMLARYEFAELGIQYKPELSNLYSEIGEMPYFKELCPNWYLVMIAYKPA